MIKNSKGGGNTITGLYFEGKTDLATFLNEQNDYHVIDDSVYYQNKLVAYIFKKHKFYKYLKKMVLIGNKLFLIKSYQMMPYMLL